MNGQNGRQPKYPFMHISGLRKSEMATRMDDERMAEECGECNRKTPHEVHIQLLTESQKEENAQFSREPYRVSTCRACGAEETVRMNNV